MITHKTQVHSQLFHRRACEQNRQTSARMPTTDGSYDSPHHAFQTSHRIVRSLAQVENNHDEMLAYSGIANGGLFGNAASVTDLESNGKDRLLPQGERSHSLQWTCSPNNLAGRMTPIFRTLKLFGFYGHISDPEALFVSNSSHRTKGEIFFRRSTVNVRCFILTTYALLSTLFNIGLFGFNIFGIELARAHVGLLHVLTMTNIISGMKPLHNAFNLLFFLRGARYHAILWRQLADIDYTFRRHLAVKLDVRKYKWIFFGLTIFSFGVPFAMRASEYFLLETAGEMLISDLSLLFVPMLSIWQLMPLYYYLLITSFIQWWFKKLRVRLQNDPELTDHSLEFYYRLYLKLTKSVCTLGSFFNPVAFFSISTSVVVLCLTIYFLTNAQEIILSEGPEEEKLASYFYVGWSGVHILVAVAYVLTMCIAGWRTNERARDIMGAVLSTKPTDEQSRFRVNCFIHRNQTQWNWGISVWRAFPVERSFLFTLVSAISTYAVLLLKLQQKACICGVQQQTFNETGHV